LVCGVLACLALSEASAFALDAPPREKPGMSWEQFRDAAGLDDPEALSNTPLGKNGGYPVDLLWTVVAAILVFWMQAGFALVEAGFTRAKNTINILMKNLLDFSVGSITGK
jgi:hypothetical protein